jgi:hypothetical protein
MNNNLHLLHRTRGLEFARHFDDSAARAAFLKSP